MQSPKNSRFPWSSLSLRPPQGLRQHTTPDQRRCKQTLSPESTGSSGKQQFRDVKHAAETAWHALSHEPAIDVEQGVAREASWQAPSLLLSIQPALPADHRQHDGYIIVVGIVWAVDDEFMRT